MNVKMMTVEQFAERVQLSKKWVYELIRQGKIPAYRLGRTLRISESALEDLKTAGGDHELEEDRG